MTFDYIEGKFVLISNTDDFGVEGETWKLNAVKRSTYSETAKRDAVVEIVITWRNPCIDDEITFDSTIDDFSYLIGQDKEISKALTWS